MKAGWSLTCNDPRAGADSLSLPATAERNFREATMDDVGGRQSGKTGREPRFVIGNQSRARRKRVTMNSAVD